MVDTIRSRIGDIVDLKELGSRIDLDRLTEILDQRKSKKTTNTVIFVLAIVVTIVLAAGIAFLVYRYLTPAYTDDFDDEFEDFEDEEDQ